MTTETLITIVIVMMGIAILILYGLHKRNSDRIAYLQDKLKCYKESNGERVNNCENAINKFLTITSRQKETIDRHTSQMKLMNTKVFNDSKSKEKSRSKSTKPIVINKQGI